MARDTSGSDLKKEIITKLNLKASDISVRYDGSYRVTIKTWIPLSKVEEIAKSRESYQRDDRTGEILCGGNTFVFVDYDYKLELTEELINAVKSLPVITWGQGYTSDSSKYYHYSRMLAEILNWDQKDAGCVLTKNYELCKEIYSR